jgi:hypothetical protein
MIGLVVNIINKTNILEKTFSINNLDDAKNELINYLATEFNKLHIDFPAQLIQFEYIWCEHQSMDHIDNIFYYNLFDGSNGTWHKPWEYEEIYNDILEKIIELEENNNKNYNIDDDDLSE